MPSTFEKCPTLIGAKKNIPNQHQSSLVTKAANAFSRILYKELRKVNQENLIVSPFSLSTALAMITPGAKGRTHTQVVYFDLNLHRYCHLFASKLKICLTIV